jgi:hypothetical protein
MDSNKQRVMTAKESEALKALEAAFSTPVKRPSARFAQYSPGYKRDFKPTFTSTPVKEKDVSWDYSQDLFDSPSPPKRRARHYSMPEDVSMEDLDKSIYVPQSQPVEPDQWIKLQR